MPRRQKPFEIKPPAERPKRVSKAVRALQERNERKAEHALETVSQAATALETLSEQAKKISQWAKQMVSVAQDGGLLGLVKAEEKGLFDFPPDLKLLMEAEGLSDSDHEQEGKKITAYETPATLTTSPTPARPTPSSLTSPVEWIITPMDKPSRQGLSLFERARHSVSHFFEGIIATDQINALYLLPFSSEPNSPKRFLEIALLSQFQNYIEFNRLLKLQQLPLLFKYGMRDLCLRTPKNNPGKKPEAYSKNQIFINATTNFIPVDQAFFSFFLKDLEALKKDFESTDEALLERIKKETSLLSPQEQLLLLEGLLAVRKFVLEYYQNYEQLRRQMLLLSKETGMSEEGIKQWIKDRINLMVSQEVERNKHSDVFIKFMTEVQKKIFNYFSEHAEEAMSVEKKNQILIELLKFHPQYLPSFVCLIEEYINKSSSYSATVRKNALTISNRFFKDFLSSGSFKNKQPYLKDIEHMARSELLSLEDDQEATVEVTQERESTPKDISALIHQACIQGNLQLVRTLCFKNKDFRPGTALLFQCINLDKEKIAGYLIERYGFHDINTYQESGLSCLELAIRRGNETIVKGLMAHCEHLKIPESLLNEAPEPFASLLRSKTQTLESASIIESEVKETSAHEDSASAESYSLPEIPDGNSLQSQVKIALAQLQLPSLSLSEAEHAALGLLEMEFEEIQNAYQNKQEEIKKLVKDFEMFQTLLKRSHSQTSSFGQRIKPVLKNLSKKIEQQQRNIMALEKLYSSLQVLLERAHSPSLEGGSDPSTPPLNPTTQPSRTQTRKTAPQGLPFDRSAEIHRQPENPYRRIFIEFLEKKSQKFLRILEASLKTPQDNKEVWERCVSNALLYEWMDFFEQTSNAREELSLGEFLPRFSGALGSIVAARNAIVHDARCFEPSQDADHLLDFYNNIVNFSRAFIDAQTSGHWQSLYDHPMFQLLHQRGIELRENRRLTQSNDADRLRRTTLLTQQIFTLTTLPDNEWLKHSFQPCLTLMNIWMNVHGYQNSKVLSESCIYFAARARQARHQKIDFSAAEASHT